MEETRLVPQLLSLLSLSRTRFHSFRFSNHFVESVNGGLLIDDFVASPQQTRGKIKLDPFLPALRYPPLTDSQTGIDFSPVGWVIISARIARIEPQMTRKTARKARRTVLAPAQVWSPTFFSSSFPCVKIALPSWTIDHPICEYYRSLWSDACKHNSPLPRHSFLHVILAEIRVFESSSQGITEIEGFF